MGSKTKTYSDLQVNNMFDITDNLWGHELARVAASVGSMRSVDILPVIINDSTQFYNERVFDKMGVSANVTLSQGKLTKDGIGAYINQNIDPTIQYVVDWFYIDDSDVSVNGIILKTYESLEDLYTHTGTYQNWFFQELDGDRYQIDFLPYNVNGTEMTVRKRIYSTAEVPDTQIVNDVYGVWMSPFLEDGTPDHANAVHVKLPTDDRSVMAVKYQTTNDTMKHVFIFDNEVTDSATLYSALVIPFYKNFAPVPDNRELDFILNRFGLGAKDEDGDTLKDSMAESEDLKHSFISYSMDRNDDKYGHWVDFLYGKEDGKEEEECEGWYCNTPSYNATPSRITVSGDYFITYSMSGTLADDGMSETNSYIVSVEHETKQADTGFFYIIPVEFLKKQTLPDKFEAYKRTFNMWMYAEKTVKIKWYQTTFFRILIMIVGIVLAYFTGGMSLNMAIANLVVGIGIMVLQQINPELAAVLGVVLAVITFNPSNIAGSLLSVANSLVTAYSTFSTIAFQESMNAIKTEIKKTGDETKELSETLSNMWHEGIYVPLDTMDNVFTMMSDGGETFNEMLYNQSDMIELAMENLTNPNARLT